MAARQYWLIKGRPERNDFEVWLEPMRADTWVTARPPRSWAKDDRLFFWKAAPDLAVVGLGVLRSAPASRGRGEQVRFGVTYLTGYLPHAVHISEARERKALKDASFLKSGPSGTVFPLSLEQARVLYGLTTRRNPEYSGVWPEFAASAPDQVATDIDDLPVGGTEGRRRLVSHLTRERDRGLVRAKKAAVLRERGHLACEVCGFDFAARYGELGQNFCEVHHLLPLAALSAERRTKLADLAVICSNCHRMAHRHGKVRGLDELRERVRRAG